MLDLQGLTHTRGFIQRSGQRASRIEMVNSILLVLTVNAKKFSAIMLDFLTHMVEID